MKKRYIHSEGFQKAMGCVGALLLIGITISDYADPGGLRLGPVYLAFVVFFLASVR